MTRKKHRDAPASTGLLEFVDRSALQTVQKKATVQDFIDCNTLLRQVQSTPDLGISYKYQAFDFDQAP